MDFYATHHAVHRARERADWAELSEAEARRRLIEAAAASVRFGPSKGADFRVKTTAGVAVCRLVKPGRALILTLLTEDMALGEAEYFSGARVTG